MADDTKLYSTDEVARLFGVTPQWIRHLAKAERIPSQVIRDSSGGVLAYRFTAAHIEAAATHMEKESQNGRKN